MNQDSTKVHLQHELGEFGKLFSGVICFEDTLGGCFQQGSCAYILRGVILASKLIMIIHTVLQKQHLRPK